VGMELERDGAGGFFLAMGGLDAEEGCRADQRAGDTTCAQPTKVGKECDAEGDSVAGLFGDP
jgi:hypothetical protein